MSSCLGLLVRRILAELALLALATAVAWADETIVEGLEGGHPLIQIVATAGTGASISPRGTRSLASGSSQSYQIAASSTCYVITDVFVDGVSLGPIASHTFSDVSQNHRIHAVATPVASYTITPTADLGGTISPGTAQTVGCGGSRYFAITPDACKQISSLKVDGVFVRPRPYHTFTNVSANHTIEATFAPVLPIWIVSTTQLGVAVSPLGTNTVACGDSLRFTITSNQCPNGVDVKIDGVSFGPLTSYTFYDVRAAHTIAASISQFTIAASADTGASISPAGLVAAPCGGSRTFAIAPLNDCYVIADVQVDGVSKGPLASYTFNDVQSIHSISVTAIPSSFYAITPTAGPGGTIFPSGPQSVACGTNYSFTFVADDCRTIADVLVDGISVGKPASYTFSNVRADHSVAVSFDTLGFQYAITTFVPPGATISPPFAAVTCGGAATFTIATNVACSGRLDVKVDDVSQGPLSSYTFANVHANHTIQATLLPYTITATAGIGGTISPSGAVSVACGSDQTFTLHPFPGTNVADLMVDGVSVGPAPSYTLSSVAADHTIHAIFADASPPDVRLIYPNGGEVLVVGDASKISWTASDFSGVASVRLSVSRNGDGGPWETIATGLSNSGTYAWPMVTGPGGNTNSDPVFSAYFRVDAMDGNGFEAFDTSDQPISIYDMVTGTLVAQDGRTVSLGNLSIEAGMPVREFGLIAVGPNPARGQVVIQYAVAKEAPIDLAVIDLQGRTVAKLANGTFRPGRYDATWNGRLEHGDRVPAAVYFIRFRYPGKNVTRRVAITR